METILFLILPTLITAQINIEIIPASDGKEASVFFAGSERGLVEVTDIKTFHLTETEVKENLKQMGYLNPGKINKDLNILLKPVSTRIIRHSENVERIQKKYYNKDNADALFELEVNHRFEETLQSRWYEARDISIGRNIIIRTTNDRINRASAWGQNDYVSKNTKLHTSDVSFPLAGKQNLSLDIHATLASTKIKVEYEVSLEGKLFFEDFCNYFIKVICLNKHQLEINDYFQRLDTMRGTFKAHQIISIDYYSNIQLTVTDMSNEAILLSDKLKLEDF